MRASVFTWLLVLCFAAPLMSIDAGDVAPDFKFYESWNMPGGEKSLGQLRGRVVMVELWATW